MLFNSWQFIFVLLPLTVAVYWILLRHHGRSAALMCLLVASLAFFAYASVTSLVITLCSLLPDFLIARLLLRSDLSELRRAWLLTGGIVVNVAMLCYFKYMSFFVDSANALLGTHWHLAQVLLPLGISFLAFQRIAFLSDVKAGIVKQFGWLDFLQFMIFFPRLVAGPIVRYNEVIPQLVRVSPSKIGADVTAGLCLFSIGLFKKAVIADSVAGFVPAVFDVQLSNVAPPGLLTAWLGVLAYTLEVYFDFSGYSDMALGVARMFGVKLPMNFNSPLKSSSILEFWSRWHMTLTRFLTTYIYTPISLHLTRARFEQGKAVLQGPHTAPGAIGSLICVPTMVTMIIAGVWHGAGWQYVIFGALHGCCLTVNQIWRMFRPRFWPDQRSYRLVMQPLGWLLTFTVVAVGLVFFRSASVRAALSILGSMAGMNGILSQYGELLRTLRVPISWQEFLVLQPIAPFAWIAILFASVILLPNSLEFLRPFQPSLESPEPQENASVASTTGNLEIDTHIRPKTSLSEALRSAWKTSLALRLRVDVASTRLIGIICALLFSLGLMALNRGQPFIYMQF